MCNCKIFLKLLEPEDSWLVLIEPVDVDALFETSETQKVVAVCWVGLVSWLDESVEPYTIKVGGILSLQDISVFWCVHCSVDKGDQLGILGVKNESESSDVAY